MVGADMDEQPRQDDVQSVVQMELAPHHLHGGFGHSVGGDRVQRRFFIDGIVRQCCTVDGVRTVGNDANFFCIVPNGVADIPRALDVESVSCLLSFVGLPLYACAAR